MTQMKGLSYQKNPKIEAIKTVILKTSYHRACWSRVGMSRLAKI